MTLTTTELTELVEAFASDENLWREHVRYDADERQYVRISASEDVEVYVISWMAGHDTGFHDHDDAGAAIAVLEGALLDERLALGGEPVARLHEAGGTFTVEPAAIHRVRHPGGAPALTLHAYSPPLRRVGSYEVAEDGTLLRHARDGEERLEDTPVAA